MNFTKKIQQFISFWYLRYLLVTELYMVEPWEKAVVHATLAIFFALFWFFNYSIVLNGVAHFRNINGLHIEQELTY